MTFELTIDDQMETSFVLETCCEDFDDDQDLLNELRACPVGEVVKVGGGAAPSFEYKRIA